MPRHTGLPIVIVAVLWSVMGCSESDTHPVTFNRDIAPIVFEHCAVCHGPGEAAPFSLVTYKIARKRARQMAEVTGTRCMPPWLPEPGPVPFAGEDRRRLSDEQMDLQRQ